MKTTYCADKNSNHKCFSDLKLKSQLPLLEKNDKWWDIFKTVLTDLCFSTLKIFSIIIYISMWLTIHRAKLE